MIDLGIAIAWIAISAAGMKVLSVLMQTIVTNNAEAELASYMGDAPSSFEANPIRHASIDLG